MTHDYRVAIRYAGVTTYEPARNLADAWGLWRSYAPHLRVRDGRAWIERREVGRWKTVPR